MLEEAIDLDIEDQNEVLFKVRIEGTDPAPAKVRLVFESGDMSYMVNGHPMGHDDLVQFIVPAMSNKMKEGSYTARVEVLVENRYFTPVQFNANFKKTMKVVAEAVQVPRRQPPPTVTVTAAPIVVPRPITPPAPPPAPQRVPPPPVPTPDPPIRRTAPAVPARPSPPVVPVRRPPQPVAESALARRVATKESNQDDDDAVRTLARSLVSEILSSKRK